MSLLSQGGTLNYVLPSALMFEESSQQLRQHFLTQHQMTFFYSFENREGIFPDVHRSYKFAMMQIRKTPPQANDSIRTAYYLTKPELFLDKTYLQNKTIHYTLAQIKQLSCDQWSMMELYCQHDLDLLNQCYAKFPKLNSDWLDFRTELHMTQDQDLFIEPYNHDLLPLFEGKMIWQFDDQLAKPQYGLKSNDFDDRLKSKELHRMAQDLGITKSACTQHYADAIRFDRSYFRLAFRGIASDTNERTLIATLLPKNCGFGHSMFASIPKTYCFIQDNDHTEVSVIEKSVLELLFACAWFNSLVADWIMRRMVQINVSKTYLMRLPMPQPTQEEILQNEPYRTLAKNALLLILSYDWESFKELAPLFNIQPKDHALSKTDKGRDQLRYQNDVIVATLYGLKPNDLTYLLQSFPIMCQRQPAFVIFFAKNAM